MANNVGLGSGYSNPYLQAAKLNASGPAASYDPSQTLDATQMAQQVFQQQAAARSQAFNQENPRMALPQNIGSALGNFINQTISPSQSSNPAQGTQQDPTPQIQQEYYKRLAQQVQANGGNYGAAQYAAATSLASDPQYSSSPAAQAFASNVVAEAKKNGYTPETEASTEASNAARDASTATAKDKDIETKLTVQKARDSQQYVPVKWTKDSTGAMYPAQTGPNIPAFIDNNGTVDPDLEIKKNAAIQAAGGAKAGAAIMPLADYNANKAAQAEMARQTALMKAQQQEKERTDAMGNVNQDLANANGARLRNGDMTLQDFTGSSPAAIALKEASMKAADDQSAAAGTTWSPTDIANRKKAEDRWMSGPLYTQFQKAATVPRHLADLEDLSQTLQSGQFTPGNAVYQKYSRMIGGDVGQNIPSFELAKKVFAMELGGALNQRGGSNEDRQALESSIQAADTPQTLTNTLHTEEKLWADKFDDMKSGYEQAVSGKKFFGDQVNPKSQQDATRIYSKFYPIDTGSGDGAKFYFDKLPDSATVKTPGGRILTAGALRALQTANQGQK